MEKPALKPQLPSRVRGIPLRLVLILPFVLEVVGAVGLTGYLSFRNGQTAVHSFATQLTSQVGDRIQERIHTYLETPQLINNINLDAVESGMLNLKDFEQIQRQFWGQKRFMESVTAVYYASEAQEFVSVAKLDNGRSYLSTMKQVDRGLRHVYLLNDYGKIKSSLKPIPTYDPRLRPCYQAAKQAGKSTWSPIFQYQSNSIVAISFASPLYEPTGKFKGVLVSELHLEEISRFLQQLDISPHGQAFLMERSGELVATSTLESLFRPQSNQQFNKQNKPENFRLPATRSQNFLTQATAEYLRELGDLKAIAQPKSLSFVENYKQNFVQVVPYKDKASLDWLIVVVVPETDFIAEIDRSNHITIQLMIAALAGSLALGLMTTHWIAKPISELSQASRDLALDRLEKPVDENSPIAELEILAYTFNQMTAYLQESFEEVKDALQESEERFAKIFRTSPDPISLRSFPDGKYLEVNDSFVNLLEYSRAEILETAQDLGTWAASPEDYQQLIHTLEQTGKLQGLEIQLVSRSGAQLFCLASCELIELDGRRCLLTVAKDISDRKQLELALQKSEAKLNHVLGTATIAICSYDLYPDGKIEYDYFSPNNERIFGYTPEELFADTSLWFSRVHPSDRHKPPGVIPPQEAGTVSAEYRFYHKDGSLRWIADYVTFSRDAAKHCWIVTAAAIDISTAKRDEMVRKQIEESLRQQEANLREAQQIAHIGSWELDIATNKILWSEEKFRMLGIAPSQPVPSLEQIMQMIHPDDRADFKRVFQTAIAQGTSHKLDLRFLRSDGSVCYIENRGKPIFNEIGQVIRMVGTSLDTTYRKESEARFKQLSAAVPGNIYTVVQSVEGRVWFEYMSAAIEEIHEISVTDILQDAAILLRCIHPDDQVAYQAAIAHSAETLTLFKHEWQIITPSGKLKWLQGTSRPERRTNGDIAWYGIVIDISERKQVEASLEAQQLYLRQVVDVVPVALFMKDREGRYLMANQAFADIYGVAIAAIVGKQDADFNPAIAQVATFVTADREVMQTRQPQIISPKPISTPEGKLRWHQVSLRPLIDAKDQVQGIIGLAIDITELVQLETLLTRENGIDHQVIEEKNQSLAELSASLSPSVVAVKNAEYQQD